MRSGPGSFLWGKGGEEKNTHTKRGKKGKPARTTQRPRAGITNSNLKKTSERVGGRAGGGAAQVRVEAGPGGPGCSPRRGARGGDPSPGPFPTWDSLCAAQPDPRGGFCCILAAGGAAGVCGGGEGESGWCWGGDKGVFPGPGGIHGRVSEFRQRLPGAEGKRWLRRGASAGCEVKESKGTATL